jgi:hypothetical protein
MRLVGSAGVCDTLSGTLVVDATLSLIVESTIAESMVDGTLSGIRETAGTSTISSSLISLTRVVVEDTGATDVDVYSVLATVEIVGLGRCSCRADPPAIAATDPTPKSPAIDA